MAAPFDAGLFDFTQDWDLGEFGRLDDFPLPDERTFVGAIDEFNAVDWSQSNIWQDQAYPPQSLVPVGLPQQTVGWDQYGPSTPIDPALLHPLPVPQSVEPADHATPGLTAVPDAIDLTHMPMPLPGQAVQPRASASHMQFQYPDPSGVMVPAAPYYWPPAYHPYFPQFAFQQPTTQAQAPVYVHPPPSAKRPRHDSDEESDHAPASKRRRAARQTPPSSSESDSGKVTRACARKTEHRRESGDSRVSNSSSVGKPNAIVPRVGEKPQRMEAKDWVRINHSTRGETTRTSRINGEANEHRNYKCPPLPNSDSWQNKYAFNYVEHNGVHEFKKKKFSARKIKDYILNYPSDDLKLWIQVSPADSARRYASPGHSKCLFKDCPKHLYEDNGTIEVGHYQVAFDEKFKKHGNKVVDPFDVVGYVHLYCLERFCDFAEICQWADVEVDTRVDLPREPRQAKWTMSGRPEADPAQAFLRACKNGNPRQHKSFTNYPVHVYGSPKAFEHTITAAMVDINIQHRTTSQIKQFVDRKLTPSTILISRGDLDLSMTQKKIKLLPAYKKAKKEKRHNQFDFAAYYDDFDPLINQRIAHWKARNQALQAQPKGGRRRGGGGKVTTSSKRKVAHFLDSEDEAEFSDAPPSPDEDILAFGRSVFDPNPNSRGRATRSSPRKKARVDYTASGDQSPNTTNFPPTPTHPSYVPHGYLPATATAPRQDSISHLLPPVADQQYTLDKYAGVELGDTQGMTDEQMALLLQRRQSSIVSQHQARSQARRGSNRAGRKASFKARPVSDQKVFDKDEPPNRVVQGRRRSVRLAGKA